MTSLIIVATTVLLILTGACVAVACCTIFSKKEKKVCPVDKSKVYCELNTLKKEDATPSKKASAFYGMMEKDYVVMPLTLNTGNKYNDGKQQKRFCSNMTVERATRLNALEIRR